MKANEVQLISFMAQPKTQFIIPVYQRNYDWTETQCQQLLNDIIEVGSKSGGSHFIGSIVFIHDGVYTSSDVRQLVVIDGQQRLTSISLLYLALLNFAAKHNLSDQANEIKETFILNKFVKEESSKLKLKQSDSNARAFNYLLSENDPVNYSDFSRIIENYCFFHNSISTDNMNVILNGLNRLLFVEISLERGKDDPQRIFESLNSTGLELSQADLIRNYILMGLEPNEQEKIFHNYWDVIEQNAKDISTDGSKVSEFIRDYLTFKTKKIPNKNKIYIEFKSRFKERNQKFYLETLNELKEFSYHYSKLLNPLKEKDDSLRSQIEYINRLESNSSFPFLLPVYQDYSKGLVTLIEFISILKLIQSFVWRRFIFNLQSNAHNKIFMALYSDVDKSDYVQSIQRALLKKKGAHKFPTNKDIEVALEEKDVYNIQSKNRVYFLELLENYNNREFVSIENPDITIEHIFPQRPDEVWYNKLDEKSISLLKDKYLNTIANLTLSGNNGSLSNKSFVEKQQMNKNGGEQGYSYSRLWLNQYLKEIDDWNLDTLKHRYTLLLERFFKIWQFPDIELDDEVDTDQDYTIYNAPEPKFKKLDYFIWKDEKVTTDEVSKMYYYVISSLFEENPSAFYHNDVRTLLGISTDKNDLRSPYPINAYTFIEANIDNNSKFRRLRILLDKLNCEEDLLINFSDLEPDEFEDEVKDRNYWNSRANGATISIVDDCFKILQSLDDNLSLNYNLRYIGISKKGKVNNFVIFSPKQNFVWTAIRLNNMYNWVERLRSNNFHILSIGSKGKRLKFRISQQNIESDKNILTELFSESYHNWMD